MIVLLTDFLMGSVLFFFTQFLSYFRPQLVEPDAAGRGKIVGTLDPVRWAKAAHCKPNHAIADGSSIVFGSRHWLFTAACVGLCVHVPACVTLYLMYRMAPYAMPWRPVAVSAVAILLALSIVAVVSSEAIERLHRAMEPQFAFADAVRSWADSRYGDDNERMQAVQLIFKLLDMVPGVTKVRHEPTPGGGREYILDLLGAVCDVDDKWTDKLTGMEYETYERLCDRL